MITEMTTATGTKQNAIVGMQERHELYAQTLSNAQVDFLLQRTPKEEIKSRPGKGGKEFSYVDISYVIERLNLVFGFTWDFEVIDRFLFEAEVGVLGKLTVTAPSGAKITKQQFGQSDIKKDRGGSVLSLIDDYKGAASDALKKCASLLGIGLDVYGGEAVPEPAGRPNVKVVEGEARPAQQPTQISEAEVKRDLRVKIVARMEGLGLDRKEQVAMREWFTGTPSAQMSVDELTAFWDWLQQFKSSKHAKNFLAQGEEHPTVPQRTLEVDPETNEYV